MTGIELAPDSCVLVDVRHGKGLPRMTALHVVEPSGWPPPDLAQIRRRKRFSTRANVVAWAADEPALQTLSEAGFIVDRILTPEEALATLATERPRPDTRGATAWLALSRHGAAIVIARGQDVLYSRRIAWRYKTVTRLNEQLLQRYSLVAHLAPELRHGIDVVRTEHGVGVDSAVTCGGLPDLRSLTMPLIEELDLEVETLDSLDGLEAVPSALVNGVVEHAPALRLACAVAALPPAEVSRSTRWWVPAAAAGALALVAAAWWALFLVEQPFRAPAVRRAEAPPPSPAATTGSSDPAVVPLVPRPTDFPQVADVSSAHEPLPSVSSILYGADRRLAIVNGAIVGEGDVVGRRRVVRIEREAVVLREATGRDVRVAVHRLKQARRP
jgi:hypothetical protein